TEELSFRVRVDNVDGTAPEIALAPVGSRYGAPDAGDSLSYVARAEGAVSAYSDNVLWDDANGDTICSWDERLGHVELPADSLYNGLDADVSGTIKLRGKVYDDQRVSRIAAAFSVGFDTNGTAAGGDVAAGTEIELAAFSGGTLLVDEDRDDAVDPASNALAFALDGKNAPELSDELGHAMNYTLTWNTAFINGVAANNVVVTIRAYNADGLLSSAATQTVDVVPYINGIATSIDTMLGASFNRSATGKYTVRVKSSATAEYETITINGFNLKPTNLVAGSESDIRLSIDEDGYDDTYVVKQGTGLAASGLSSDYTSLSATVQATGSGFLTVITNGVPSINNSNAQTASYNREDSLIQEYLSDDRYLSLWDFTPLRANAGAPYAKNAIYPSMAMAGNVPQFAYVNNSGGYGLAQFWSGSAEVKIYENWDLFTYSSLALNDDNGRAALFDVNIVQSGTDFIGDKGGIMVNMIYNPPDTTWSGTTYYYRDYNLWLDNLYKSGNLAVLGRYQYPTIKLVGTDVLSHAFYSVYDSIDDRVIFRYFRIGTNQTSVGGGSTTYATKITDSATNLYVNNTDLVQRNQNGTWPTYTNNAINNTRLGQNNDSGNTNAGQYFATGTDVGLHTAVAGISTGTLTARAILVYYSANKLYYQYATNDANTEWSTPVPLDSSVGADYVSMIVDDNDHVHIAYQDSFSGDVKYIYIPNYLVPATRKMVTVDSYMTIGSKLTLTVPTGGSVPYIAYKGLGNTAKIAWYTATPAIATLEDGVDAADRFTGAWEVQILPSTIVDSDTNRFNVGVGIDGRPVVGYANNKPGSQGIEYLTGLGELAD
ncbi:MAG TPA: hypothetical protein P5298_09625, partial [Spirochaetia bacterium]|nr:hypothetical protein [Spirochaetia bacterium]